MDMKNCERKYSDKGLMAGAVTAICNGARNAFDNCVSWYMNLGTKRFPAQSLCGDIMEQTDAIDMSIDKALTDFNELKAEISDDGMPMWKVAAIGGAAAVAAAAAVTVGCGVEKYKKDSKHSSNRNRVIKMR